jgi:hypothetical protein
VVRGASHTYGLNHVHPNIKGKSRNLAIFGVRALESLPETVGYDLPPTRLNLRLPLPLNLRLDSSLTSRSRRSSYYPTTAKAQAAQDMRSDFARPNSWRLP